MKPKASPIRSKAGALVATVAMLAAMGGGIAVTAAPAGASPPTTTTVVVGGADIAPGGPWALETTSNTGSYSFVTGPAPAPSGVGSLAMSIATGQHEWLNNYSYGACATTPSCDDTASMTPITSLDALSYSTYRTSGTSFPTYNIEVLATGTSAFTTFVFVPNAGSRVNNTWQTWDGLNPSDGTWFSTHTLATAPFNCAPQSCSASWSAIQAAYPNAKVWLGLGPNLGTDTDFTGNIDDFTVGVSGATTIYNFEPPTAPTLSLTPLPATSQFGDFEGASVTISDGDQPTGSLNITLYSASAHPCIDGAEEGSTDSVFAGTSTYSGDTFQINDEFTGTGTWYLQATYSGDANNLASASACVPFTVNPGDSVTSVTPTPWSGSGPLLAQANVNDLDVGGVHTGSVDGLVTFRLYSNSTCTTAVPGYTPEVAAIDPTDPNNPVAETPAGFSPIPAGSYYWQATYAGNSVYTGSQSSCTLALLNHTTVPGAPVPAFGLPFNDHGAKVVWRVPTNIGGSPVTAYRITPYKAGVAQAVHTFNSSATTELITGLTDGVSYQFAIAAKNAVGWGPLSAKTPAMIAGAPGQPGLPTAVKVASGSLKVTFKAPMNDGAAITGYSVTCTSTNSGAPKTKTGTASPITVTGLTHGKSYRCAVKATNARGTGPLSNPSAAVNA